MESEENFFSSTYTHKRATDEGREGRGGREEGREEGGRREGERERKGEREEEGEGGERLSYMKLRLLGVEGDESLNEVQGRHTSLRTLQNTMHRFKQFVLKPQTNKRHHN